MPSLNMQSDREVRYHERCQQKKLQQQNMDRDDRVQRRDDMRSEISMEVRDEIQQLTQKKKGCNHNSKWENRCFILCLLVLSLFFAFIFIVVFPFILIQPFFL